MDTKHRLDEVIYQKPPVAFVIRILITLSSPVYDLPFSNVLQIVGDVVDHLLSKVLEFWSFHIDLIEE